MEVHKERALVQFLRRAGKPLNELMKEVDGVIYVLQDSYYLLDDKWRKDKKDFLKLMIIDGCFMFEVLHFAANIERDYSPCDPVFSQHGIHHIMPYIRRDMLLIENQLPLLLLTTLVAFQNQRVHEVPAFVRSLNSKAFTPQLISFGPYHHEDCELKQIEVHKERALVQFLRRAGKPLNELMKEVDGVIYVLQDSYYLLDDKWWKDKKDFLKLMIIDGCFMFEVLHFAANIKRDYSPCDPVFSQYGIHHIMPYIRRDMLLIENQLPLLLLTTLVAFQNQRVYEDIDSYVDTLVLKFLIGSDNNVDTTSILGNHALGLFRESLLRPQQTTQSRQPPHPISGTICVLGCAVELNEAGVRFRTGSTNNLRNIQFNPNTGILYLPFLMVDDATESTFLNIMAYEHLYVKVDHDVTSYVCFMDKIIDSSKDVSLLHDKGIILNCLGSNKEVADLFNRISKETTIDLESSLFEVQREVNGYCQKKRNKWRANLMHTYFRNPWSALSLAGALFLLVLTIIQAIVAILQYFHDK